MLVSMLFFSDPETPTNAYGHGLLCTRRWPSTAQGVHIQPHAFTQTLNIKRI